jgi:hypothetical protein
MSQLTIYLDEETRCKAGRAAKREGLSLSRWARNKLAAASEEGKQWPAGFFELAGSIGDESFDAPAELRSKEDLRREEL